MSSNLYHRETEQGTLNEIRPLPERLRPRTLDEFQGQEHLLGPGAPLRRLIESDRLISMIFWGEPGTGKTTLAQIIAHMTHSQFLYLSAVMVGVPDLRKVLDLARHNRRQGKRTILFLDEIHRWSKLQQDALLHAVEDGTITLIGATTENPSFEVIGPLLSRCRVFRFHPLSANHISLIVNRALEKDPFLTEHHITLSERAKEALVQYADGDARIALTVLELAAIHLIDQRQQLFSTQPEIEGSSPLVIDLPLLEQVLQEKLGRYDKKGDYHYDTISAFIKSLRGSDPDAAVYWLARMLEAGEDPLFIARRMIILASEDIGNANPQALPLAVACAQAVQVVGLPEAALNLAHTAIYLASSPKSNACYRALREAQEEVKKEPNRPVPLPLRNPVTPLMRAMDYGRDYRYDHDYGGFSGQEHLPHGLEGRIFYYPSQEGEEKQIKERLQQLWPKRRTASKNSSQDEQ